MTKTLFEKTIESIDNQDTDFYKVFGGLTPVSQGVSTAHRIAHKLSESEWERNVLAAERFVNGIIRGRVKIHKFQEAMSTSLFPGLFADSLDRQMYGAYAAAPTTWRNYCRRATVADFKKVKRFAGTGIRGLLSEVKELSEHERRTMDIGEYGYSVKKYEAGFGISFEAMVNDDLDAFGRLPQDLAQSAIDTEEYFATSLYADANGPKAGVFNLANDNVIGNNEPLTRSSLQAAITKLMSRKDERGNPIVVTAVELVVGTGITLAAKEILNAQEYRVVGPEGNITIIQGNGVDANLRINTNYWLPTVITNTAIASTSWFLFANPGSSSRPAIEVGFLRGYEQPQLFEKIPDMRKIGGGAEVPWSYEHGSMEKKIQHIFGGSFIDARMALASKGDGSAAS